MISGSLRFGKSMIVNFCRKEKVDFEKRDFMERAMHQLQQTQVNQRHLMSRRWCSLGNIR